MKLTQDTDSVIYPKHIPELGLLAAVLEMAYRDLTNPTCRALRRSSIMWFRGKLDTGTFPEFSFREIAKYLNLSPSQIKFIYQHVVEAEDREYKFQKERVKSRAGISPLVERERHNISPTHAAV